MGIAMMTCLPRSVSILQTDAIDTDTGRVRLVAEPGDSGGSGDGAPGPMDHGESESYEIEEPKGWKRGLLPNGAQSEPDTIDTQEETLIPLRLLLVDDSHLFLGTLRRLLDTMSTVDVVGVATSGREALELVDRLKPEIVLTDLAMPEMDGLELTRRLATRPERPTIIIMSAHDLPTYRQATREAGADAFVTKADLVNQLEPLMRHLFNRPRPGA
jgi:CheY-like chemotaxis protein